MTLLSTRTHKQSTAAVKRVRAKRQKKLLTVKRGFSRGMDIICDGKPYFSDVPPGDVYKNGRRLPPGKNVFDVLKSRKKK